MTEEFQNFTKCIKEGLKTGEIRISRDLTDFDLAVQFAVGKIGERKGYPCDVTIAEIEKEILKFAPELMEEEG